MSYLGRNFDNSKVFYQRKGTNPITEPFKSKVEQKSVYPFPTREDENISG
jgi:hypothetical protein